MATENCIDCPQTCFGNELDSSCVVHDGKSLKGVIDDLSSVTPETPSSSDVISSDNIVSKSKIRNTSYICSSNIVQRTAKYTLSVTATTTTFGWNLLDVISNLPSGYDLATIRVRVIGAGTNSQLITDSSSPSSGVTVKLDQYPIAVDFWIRVTSPCGDIDLQKTINIVSTTGSKGTYNFVLDVRDLNPQSGEIVLTDQLNSLEAQVNTLTQKLDTFGDPTLTLKTHTSQINDLQGELGSPEQFIIANYTADDSLSTNTIIDIVNDLYIRIGNLQDTISEQEVELESLRSQIDSINS